jgi:hypothetical protein
MDPVIYKAALAIHIAGITIMAGATVIDFVSFRQFWKIYTADKVKGFVMENVLHSLQRFIRIGLLVILISGVTMMAYLHQVWGEQLWFRIKMVVLVLILINGLGIRRRLGSAMKKILHAELPGENQELGLATLREKINVVQILQLLFFAIIFVLSVFKFN